MSLYHLAKKLKPQLKVIDVINLETSRPIGTFRIGKFYKPLIARHYTLKDNLHKFRQKQHNLIANLLRKKTKVFKSLTD
jgi:hypothetical protein